MAPALHPRQVLYGNSRGGTRPGWGVFFTMFSRVVRRHPERLACGSFDWLCAGRTRLR
jgi:hypothetical protein